VNDISDNKPPIEESERQAVTAWTDKVRSARDDKWEDDFDRMRKNEEFITGLQWEGQKEIRSKKYVCNITLQRINQKVATLYARNPQATAKRRERLDFQLWDGRVETLATAVMGAQQSLQTGIPDLQSVALLADYQRGKQWQELVNKVGRSLEIVYQYECDTQEPDFKSSMKNSLVRAATVCGVGYVRLNFVREVPQTPSSTQAPQSTRDKVGRIRQILDGMEKGDVQTDGPEAEQLRSLTMALGTTAMYEQSEVKERLVFDYPASTSIIPDPRCKDLSTFRGARWVAQEYLLPLDEVNAFFGTEIKPGGDLRIYNEDGEERPIGKEVGKSDVTKPIVALWEIFDITTRSHLFVVDGWEGYVLPPEPLVPYTRRFWPIFGLVFNSVIADDGSDVSIFPPSDVDLMFHPQKEWNRTRDALRAQRRANAPKYFVRQGLMTDEDKEKLDTAKENEVIELQGIPGDKEPDKFIVPASHAPIDPLAYDTKPLSEDIMLGAGAQEANFGYAKPNVTATVGTIAEQSRMTVASSNVDDLDGVLTLLARAGGEMLLREMSVETVKRIAGPGAVWPVENRDDFLNEIQLEVVAASSGRPNKAIEIANFERIAPMLLQAGANPMFVIREAVKRLDDRLDINEAFPPPMGIPQVPGTPSESQQPAVQGPQQPLQELPSGASTPLPAA